MSITPRIYSHTLTTDLNSWVWRKHGCCSKIHRLWRTLHLPWISGFDLRKVPHTQPISWSTNKSFPAALSGAARTPATSYLSRRCTARWSGAPLRGTGESSAFCSGFPPWRSTARDRDAWHSFLHRGPPAPSRHPRSTRYSSPRWSSSGTSNSSWKLATAVSLALPNPVYLLATLILCLTVISQPMHAKKLSPAIFRDLSSRFD